MSAQTETLKAWIQESSRIVFFGGAGVSTESGIPDFRSVDGLYNQKYDEPPETIISHSYFMRKPEAFYRFYKDKMIYRDAKPNDCHLALAKLEREGKLQAVITQNIDGLHQLAGSKTVIELHGSTLRNYCLQCRKAFDVDYVLSADGVPRCDACGSVVRPDVVLYEENLHDGDMERAIESIRKADLFIVGGTSLTVYPAAGLVEYYRGDKLVLINKSPTAYDRYANLVIAERIGRVFHECVLS